MSSRSNSAVKAHLSPLHLDRRKNPDDTQQVNKKITTQRQTWCLGRLVWVRFRGESVRDRTVGPRQQITRIPYWRKKGCLIGVGRCRFQSDSSFVPYTFRHVSTSRGAL